MSKVKVLLTRSVYMQPKQREMDGIIEKIYNSLTTKTRERTLIVICGDHGMNDVLTSLDESDCRLAIMADLPLEKLLR